MDLKPLYEVGYADRGTSLVLKADLECGWRKLKKTYGFSGQKRIRYKGDWSIRAQLQLIAQPATFEEWGASFPGVSLKRRDSLISYTLNQKQLEVKIALTLDQPWRMMSSRRPGLYIEELSSGGETPHTADVLAKELKNQIEEKERYR